TERIVQLEIVVGPLQTLTQAYGNTVHPYPVQFTVAHNLAAGIPVEPAIRRRRGKGTNAEINWFLTAQPRLREREAVRLVTLAAGLPADAQLLAIATWQRLPRGFVEEITCGEVVERKPQRSDDLPGAETAG